MASCSGTPATAAGRRRYIVRASFGPNDPNPPVQLPLGSTVFNLGIPPGSYYVHVVAVNACGTSAPSNEIVVTAPANTPEHVAESAAGPAAAAALRARPGVPVRRRGPRTRLPEPSVACPPRAGHLQPPVPARSSQDAAQRLHRLHRVEAAHHRQALRLQRQADAGGGARRSSPATRSPITTARTPQKARPTSTWSMCSAATAPASAAIPTATTPTTACSTTSSAAGPWPG